jgi:hypothetical protein
MSLPVDLAAHLADVRAVYWTASVELEERIAAIVAVGEVYQANAYNLEHLLVGLVQFLDRGEVSREASVAALLAFISAEPPRAGAVEAVEFVAGVLGWEELKEGLEKLRDSETAYYVNRDLALSALEAFDPQWRGGAYRTFKYRRPAN